MSNDADNLQAHINDCAAYGGHDAHGGHQKPRGKVSSPAPIASGPVSGNVIPQPQGPVGIPLAGPLGPGGRDMGN